MKKAIFTFFMFFTLQLSFAQVSFVGNPDYGQLRNFVYDKFTPNKVYATTFIDKHIMVSNDNGATWSVFYTLSYPAYSANISQVKLANNGTALSFIQYFGGANSRNKIIVLDLQSLNILKEYAVPSGEGVTSINNYSIFNDGTLNKVTMLTNGSYNKFFTTTNGGASWSKVYDGADHEGVILDDAVMSSTDSQKLYIARNGGPGNVDGGFLTSTDGGATWTETLNGLILQSIAVDPQNGDNVYVGTGVRWSYLDQHEAVYKSTNGGSTWTEQTGITWSTATHGLLNVPKIEINPNDTNHVVVMADERIAVTTDAGATWISTPHNGLADGTSYFYGINAAFNPNNLNGVLISNNRYAKYSSDRGVTLTTLTNPFFECMGKLDIVKKDGEDQLLYGVQYGYALKNLVNNQETPINVYPLSEFPIGQQIGLVYSDKKNPGRVYTYESSFMGNNINVSDDYGVNVTPIYNTFDNGFTAAETDPSNPNIVWLATFNGENASLVKVNFADLNNVQTDYITLPYDGDYLQGIKINESNSNEILITVGNEVLKTTNGGTSWTQITAGLEGLTLPNIAISLSQNPLDVNQYTIAASNGIYTSLDSGNTWNKIYTGLVQKVEHSSQQNGQMIAIGTSYGTTLPKVIYINNSGTTWQERTSSNYFNTIILDGTTRFINPTTAEVYLSTQSLGIIKDVIDFSTLATGNPAVSKDDISIYPNPVSDIVNIKMKDAASFKVSVYSAAGQLLLTSANKTSMDISQLPKGVYLLKLDRDNMKTVVKKIIKK